MPELQPRRAQRCRSVDLAAALAQPPDCAVICTDHSGFDYDALVDSGTLIVDTRNALKDRQRRDDFPAVTAAVTPVVPRKPRCLHGRAGAIRYRRRR